MRGYGGNSNYLGYAQGDAIRNITGYAGLSEFLNPTYHGSDHWGVPSYVPTGAFTYSFQGLNKIWQLEWYGQGKLTNVVLDASRQVPTANEVRPVNKAVRYLIRSRS